MPEEKFKGVIEDHLRPGHTAKGFDISDWLASVEETSPAIDSGGSNEATGPLYRLLMSIQRLRERRAERRAIRRRNKQP